MHARHIHHEWELEAKGFTSVGIVACRVSMVTMSIRRLDQIKRVTVKHKGEKGGYSSPVPLAERIATYKNLQSAQ